MLKNIPVILSPEILKALCEMGHGDKVLIADGNFPSHSVGKDAIVLRADGIGGVEMLEAILQVLPLDTYESGAVKLMSKCDGDDTEVSIWDDYLEVLKKEKEYGEKSLEFVERFKFYDKAKQAYLIIATSEKALYANVMLTKGVI